MSATVVGMEKLAKNLSSYSDNVVKAVVSGCQLTQAQIVNHARANHSKDAHSSGRFISHHGGNGLVGSIQPGQIEISDEDVTAEIIARQPYASFVEEGTSRSKAYPYLEPAVQANRKAFSENIRRFIQRAKP